MIKFQNDSSLTLKITCFGITFQKLCLTQNLQGQIGPHQFNFSLLCLLIYYQLNLQCWVQYSLSWPAQKVGQGGYSAGLSAGTLGISTMAEHHHQWSLSERQFCLILSLSSTVAWGLPLPCLWNLLPNKPAQDCSEEVFIWREKFHCQSYVKTKQ